MCDPVPGALVVNVAVPPVSGWVDVPPPVPVIVKVTVPVGVPVAGGVGVTVAVYVTG